MPVDVFHWNPVRPVFPGRVGRIIRRRRPVNNFGDMLGPALVAAMVTSRGADVHSGGGRLLTVGSVMHFAQPGDVVWGSGINGKVEPSAIASPLDVRAVRGPLTRRLLQDSGVPTPEIFGDPALLWSDFWSKADYEAQSSQRHELSIVPNMHDWPRFRSDARAVNPRGELHEVIGRIARSRFVVGSSLHGVILAETMGIPARFMVSGTESPFKYQDYLLGTGRPTFQPAHTVQQAIDLGTQGPPVFDRAALADAFPIDLWA